MFETRDIRVDRIAMWVVAVLAAAVYVKNAWVSDDAYITFRSLEQLFAGNGPRWNPHERVQAFTSPLWFWYLALFRLFSANVFINAIVASALPIAVALVVLRRFLASRLIWVAVVVTLVSSIGFYDFTTSGLENPMAYLLIILFLLFYFSLFDATDAGEQRSCLRWMLIVAGLVVFCRHDLATLILPPAMFACVRHRDLFGPGRWASELVLALLPLIAWSLFALVYYGTPFPNTAYAKLATGIARGDLLLQGFRYLWACARYDPITIVGIAAGVVVLFRERRGERTALAWGILGNLVYVVWVGGDFMLARVLSFGFLAGVVATARFVSESHLPVRRLSYSLIAACAVYWAVVPGNPVRTDNGYRPDRPYPAGIVHERGAYPAASLSAYVRRDGEVFPSGKWSQEGLDLARSSSCCAIRKSIGYYGYWAGTEKRIIDRNALSDPFLSRLPVYDRKVWRVGHFERGLPPGYIESVRDGNNAIRDVRLRPFYDHIRLITQSERLFSGERIDAIVGLNVGRFAVYTHGM